MIARRVQPSEEIEVTISRLTYLVYRAQTVLWREEGLALAATDNERAEALRRYQISLYDSASMIQEVERFLQSKKQLSAEYHAGLRAALVRVGNAVENLERYSDVILASEAVIAALTDLQQFCLSAGRQS